ncbi:hypothetical protein LSH36_1154g00073 [Paralvinella palmiformis]|uniref:Fibrinogen C-terminal domain-containing protein n=1 Tax=Paralvinella palmiformis TaxID=53620 RepID=A0AAD9IW41_9ANNE|nr:hypothetical protein LSH36_1154g00073 [Paralvinella palmiformis]
MRRSERRNNLQICPRRDSNTGGSDLWSSTLPLDHGGALKWSGVKFKGYLPVRFQRQSLIPDEEDFLTDDSNDTRTIFSLGDDVQISVFSHFRIQLPPEKGHPTNVALIRTNMKCGGYPYASPLSGAETKTWTGRWSTCTLIQKTMSGDKENCLCDEIQIIRIPYSVEDSSWSLCDASLRFTSDNLYNKVLLRRKDGSESFNREWQDYKQGSGSLDGEFWAGNL